ncbi:hypothetical protein DOTSEDRAFT_76537 [Dothistroma septosporum NZE10]|uniref:Uncharacterized protein n=1 Tax=Dothistroma septosporum (strain NZE10 / CBS 128990) TaxID=675120 RepID=N1Q3C4_DOTSN|nr:hypothetical protein DOTSEDRAFT_76537 [Dothistroma septosporum NZE10]
MTRFFTEWPTWEKLCFILACAIAVTLVAGATKLGYTHWKLRKYVAVAEKEKMEQAMQRQISLRRATSTRKGADASFGLEALEKGIEVEGIWVSRSNTPEPGSREGSRSSFVDDVTAKGEASLAEPRITRPGHQCHSSYSADRHGPRRSTSTERTRSVERLPSRPGTAEADLARNRRSEHPPSSMSRYNTVLPGLARQDTGVSAIEAIEAIYDAAGHIKPHHEHMGEIQTIAAGVPSSHSSSEGSDNDPIAASAPNLLSQQSRPRLPSSDLDMMHSHRESLAAEIGQLAPRRRPGPSGDWAMITHAQRPSTASDTEYYSRRQSSPSSAEGEAKTWMHGNVSSSKFDALPAAVRRSSLPDVTPFAKFCKTAPASPLPELRRLSNSHSASIPGGDRRRIPSATSGGQSGQIPHAELRLATRARDADRPTAEDHVPPKQGSFEHRRSAVIRGHGSGFEILRQGTFQTVPPISLQTDPRSRSSSIESRRKLQKKRRPSEESQAG